MKRNWLVPLRVIEVIEITKVDFYRSPDWVQVKKNIPYMLILKDVRVHALIT